jgi:thiol-disulfide isomerase/thioredoxin
MTMHASPTKFASVALALAALLTVAEFSPRMLRGEELNFSDHGPAPEFTGISTWLNSSPLTITGLQGKVVLVQFWTYTCINWMRTLPYVSKWYQRYKDDGLIVIGVHAPEFAFEKETSNVEAAIKRFAITYPVAQDNQFKTWKAYRNVDWPTEYLVDKAGEIVAFHLGEGSYQKMEDVIARLVGGRLPDTRTADPDLSDIRSPEMYFGTKQNLNGHLENPLRSSSIVASQSSLAGERVYTAPSDVPFNRFAFSGTWKISDDNATLSADGGEIFLRFYAPKLNLVAGSASSQTLSITVDGKPQTPVTVQGSRLYPLYSGDAGEHVLRLTIPTAGLSAFSFTFG